MVFKYIFGPVPSRRLGISLGVDLVLPKTCSLDCVYCECGHTNLLTVSRKEYVEAEAVIKELKSYLKQSPELDFITFAGSGEPTLNSQINEIINTIKKEFPDYKVAILTNGTLFYDSDVRAAVAEADLIIPSLDAASEQVFQQINRPHPALSYKKVIAGLVKLRSEFKGKLVLEIFIVPGLNDGSKELEQIRKAIKIINPDAVQTGTLDRPGTELWVKPATPGRMNEIANYLGGAEIIGAFQSRCEIASFNKSISTQIMDTLRRRPCTAADLERILNLRSTELHKYIADLIENKKIQPLRGARGVFFKVKEIDDL